MKQQNITFLLTVLFCMASIETFAHDIEVANSDGVTIYYVWSNNNTELTVSYRGSSYNYYSNEYSGNVVIPESVYYEGHTYCVTSIGSSAFRDCTGLTSVNIPNSVASIGDYAFLNCSNLTSVTIHNLAINIGFNVFANCSKLVVNLCVPNITEFLNYSVTRSIGCPVALIDSNGNEIKEIVIPNDMTTIRDYAFCHCRGLTSVTIPNSVTSIGKNAFERCSGITSVTIPNSVTTIGELAFYGCSSLTSVVIGSGVTTIGEGALNYANIKKIFWLTNTPPTGYSNISGTVNYVSNDGYSSLRNVIKYQFLSSYFEVDGIRYVPVSPSDRTCDAIDCVYDESVANTIISSTVVHKGVTMNVKDIKPYLAYNNTNIKTLTLDNDGELADYAFTNCTNMKTVLLGKNISAIGKSAFQGCSSLESIDIPDTITILNDHMLSDCTSLKEIRIGSNVKTIDKYAFSGCCALTSITIPSTVTTINDAVFYDCTSLKSVIIADSEVELNLGSNRVNKEGGYSDSGNPFFSSCPLDTVYIGRNINYNTSQNRGYSPFYRNLSLRAVKFADKETEISENEFYGCTNLQRVIIGDGVTTIGNWAFSGCSSLKYFVFGTQVANIGQETFSDCTSVSEIISKAAMPPTCGSQALDDINKWDCKLFVPEGTLATYQNADQWKDFFFAEEGGGSDNPGIHETEKCAKPVITLADGKLNFTCQTAGVEFHYNITADGMKSGTGSKTDFTATYTITVYATKKGYDNSDTASKTISAGGTDSIVGDVNGDSKVDAADLTKLIDILLKR